MAHDWVAKRAWAWFRRRASLGALLVLSEWGLDALRNQADAPYSSLRQHLSQYYEAMALPRRWHLRRSCR